MAETNYRKLTKAQEKALMFLPADGSWFVGNAGKMASALNSLSLLSLAEMEWGDFGPRSGRTNRWRLTKGGIYERVIRA